MTMIFLLVKQRVDYDDYPISEIILHAFTTREKLEAYRIVNKLEDDHRPLGTTSNRTIYGTVEVKID